MPLECWDMLSCQQGTLAVVARGDRVARVCYECSPEAARQAVERLHPGAGRCARPVVENGLGQLSEYFLGRRRQFELALDNAGLSPFACRVHKELLKVPYGQVVTYGELAALAGSPRAARAVGRVMASNPFPLVVPCHRVVNANGTIGQYSAARGTESKVWLLDFERSRA